MSLARFRSSAACVIGVALLTLASSAAAEELTVIGFDVESGRADMRVIGNQIAGIHGVDIWGFSQVGSNASAAIEHAVQQGGTTGFRGILGTTGGKNRLLIAYDGGRFDETRHFELTDVNIGGWVRAPLVAELRFKASDRGILFMVNHLYRSNESRRYEQARRLHDWAKAQTLPVVAVGDYNFDWNLNDGEKLHDRGYDLLTAHDVCSWIPPRTFVATTCAWRRIEDFTFVAGPARDWSATSEVLFPEPSYCRRTYRTSGHRPVRTTFVLDGRSR